MSLIARIFPGSRMAREIERRKATYEVERAKRVEHVARTMAKRDAQVHASLYSSRDWDGIALWRQKEWRQLAEAAVTAMEEFDR